MKKIMIFLRWLWFSNCNEILEYKIRRCSRIEFFIKNKFPNYYYKKLKKY